MRCHAPRPPLRLQGQTWPSCICCKLSNSQLLFNDCVMSEALQEYVLICCQHPSGGLIDKPGKCVASFSCISVVYLITNKLKCTADKRL